MCKFFLNNICERFRWKRTQYGTTVDEVCGGTGETQGGANLDIPFNHLAVHFSEAMHAEGFDLESERLCMRLQVVGAELVLRLKQPVVVGPKRSLFPRTFGSHRSGNAVHMEG